MLSTLIYFDHFTKVFGFVKMLLPKTVKFMGMTESCLAIYRDNNNVECFKGFKLILSQLVEELTSKEKVSFLISNIIEL